MTEMMKGIYHEDHIKFIPGKKRVFHLASNDGNIINTIPFASKFKVVKRFLINIICIDVSLLPYIFSQYH